MIKEFQTKDILEAIEIISKMDKKKREIENKKIINKKDDVLTVNKQVKSTKSDMLVLKEMIE